MSGPLNVGIEHYARHGNFPSRRGSLSEMNTFIYTTPLIKIDSDIYDDYIKIFDKNKSMVYEIENNNPLSTISPREGNLFYSFNCYSTFYSFFRDLPH
jgi:hypothetical protein